MPSKKDWVAGSPPKRAPLHSSQPPKPSFKRIEKLARANRRSLVGRPLHTTLRKQGIVAGGGRFGPWRALSIVGLAGGLALVVAGLMIADEYMVLAGIALAGVCVIGWLWIRNKRSELGTPFLGLDVAARKLDVYLESVSPFMPEGALSKLAQIKESLARVLPALADDEKAKSVPAEERFFAQELISRYLPDICQHYVALVDTARTDVKLENNKTADESLIAQLEILHSRLEKVQALFVANQAQKLANHETFLRNK